MTIQTKKNKINVKKSNTKAKNSKKKISSPKKKNIIKKIWHGHGYDIFFGIIYLLQKFKNLCVPIVTVGGYYMTDITISYVCKYNVSNAHNEKDYDLIFPNNMKEYNFIKILKYCLSNNRFAIIPLYIMWDTCEPSGHANMLLFDSKEKTVERFEPYGTSGFSPKSLKSFLWFDNAFTDYLKKYKLDYKYKAFSLCPRVGIQEEEEAEIDYEIGTARELESDPVGYCGVWGIYYAELKLKNPDVSSIDLYKKMIKNIRGNRHSIRTYIRNYSKHIAKERAKVINTIDKSLGYTPSRQMYSVKIDKAINDILLKQFNYSK